MRNRVILAAFMAAAAVLTTTATANADDVSVTETGQGASVRVATYGGLGGGPGTSSGRNCAYTPDPDLNVGLAKGVPKTGLVRLAARGTFYDYRCSDGTAGIIYVPDPAAPQAAAVAAELAREAYRFLPLPAPQPRFSPPAGGEQLVNFPTWLWVSPATWGVRSATASVPGLSATVTAVPVEVVWSMGDGHQVVCRGPGTAYDPARPEAAQRPSCTYTYRGARDGVAVTATTVWRVSWVAHGVAAGGVLPPLARTSPVTLLRVAEVQAVNTSR